MQFFGSEKSRINEIAHKMNKCALSEYFGIFVNLALVEFRTSGIRIERGLVD